MSERDGGPAFPSSAFAFTRMTGPASTEISYVPLMGGMSLRDYFAAHAIGQAVIDSDDLHEAKKGGAAGIAELIAKACYEFADAMLKAREAKK